MAWLAVHTLDGAGLIMAGRFHYRVVVEAGGRGFDPLRAHNTQSISCPKSSVMGDQFSNREDWDIYNTRSKLLCYLEDLKKWKTSENNKKRMLDFFQRIELEGIGVVQRVHYYYAFKTFLEAVNKDFDEMIKDDIEKFLLYMRKYQSKTKHKRWACVKKFLRYIGKDTLFQDIKVSFRQKGLKLPEELLTEDEIKNMVSNATNIRDKALIFTLYESACRVGELLSRKLKHVVFDDYGAVLSDGKTGMRRIRLIQSAPLLSNWVENHPQKDNPDAFLWISLNNYKTPVKYCIINRMLSNAAKKGGIKKRIYPHLFRHSRATYLAKRLTEAS